MIGIDPVQFWPVVLIALALLFACCWILVRHAALAAVMVFSPLPGSLAVVYRGDLPSVFDFLPGFMAAVFLGGIIVPLAANMAPRVALRDALRLLWPVFLMMPLLLVPAVFVDQRALSCIGGQISAIAITAITAAAFSYDEDFIVRINRANEARFREIERLGFLTMPRWGMNIGGVVLVFSVLGFFGAQKAIGTAFVHPVLFAALGLLFLAGAFLASRNARRSIAAFLAMMPVVLLLIALLDRFAFSSTGQLLALAVAAMPVIFMAASARAFESNGDGWEVATQRGLERFGPATVVAVIASAAASVLCEWTLPAGLIECVALLLGGIAALILQPALTTMLYSLFPKRISLEEAFRKR